MNFIASRTKIHDEDKIKGCKIASTFLTDHMPGYFQMKGFADLRPHDGEPRASIGNGCGGNN
jgi:hypothetical protein